MMRKYVTGLIGMMFLFGGCSFVKSTPPKDEYTIVLDENSKKDLQSTSCKKRSLKVLEPFGAYEYTVSDMRYVVLPNEENHYNLSAWSEAPSGTLYREILESLKRSRLFKSVAFYSSVAKSDYILEMEINDFKQYFTSDLQHSHVIVDLTFTLVDAKEYNVLAQKEFVRKIEAKPLDARGGVEALNEALNGIVPDVVVWLEGICE